MKQPLAFYKGLAIGLTPLFLALALFLYWLTGLQNALVEQTNLLSEVVVQLDPVQYQVDSSTSNMIENRLISCLTSQLKTIEQSLFIEPNKMKSKDVNNSIIIIKKYWSIPPFQ